MSISNFEEQLSYEFDWRVNELSVLRTFQFFKNLKHHQKEIYLKYSFVGLYALWEGFVNSCFNNYIQEINRLSLFSNQIDISILTNDLDFKFSIKNQRNDFQKRCKLVKNLENYMKNPVILASSIPTSSNINVRVINKILKMFNMEILKLNNLIKGLDKLVLIRNNIAHGQFNIPVDKEIFNGLCQVVIDLMFEIIDRILEAYKNKTYLRIPNARKFW